MQLNLQTRDCDPKRLESYLSGGLSAAQECELISHLNTCDTCRQSLERKAADPADWGDAERLLQPTRFQSLDVDEHSDSEVDKTSTRHPLQIQNVLDALGPTDDPQMLGRLGGYEVSAIVGAGGMGVVLKAIDSSLDRTVAIKVMAPHLATSGAARKRFAREAKAAAAVLHPNVIAIHSVSNDEALPYLVMPYMRGTSLQKRLDKEGPLALIEILRIGSQIAAGLAAAHAQGLVHRDIKPANILLEDGIERVTITDFGLARAVDDATITHSGVIAGTPQYMSPEQARGEALDQRSDLFSLGSVLYAICTGRPPFRAETTYGVLRRITDDSPTPIRQVNPEIPTWLCTVISKLMSKRASDRFESATEVTELLENCLAHVQQPAAVPLPISLVTDPIDRRWFSKTYRTGVIMTSTCLILALIGMLLWQAPTPVAMDQQLKIDESAVVESSAANQPQEATSPQTDNINPPQSGADQFYTNLQSLTKQLRLREESIKRLSYQGVVRYLEKLDTTRNAGETNEAFIARYTSKPPKYSEFAAFPLAAVRDYPAKIGHVKLGNIDLAAPKFMEYYFNEKSTTQLMGVDPGQCQATIMKTRPPELGQPSETMPRMDILALRPVRDNPLALTLEKAAMTLSRPDAGGRPLFTLNQHSTAKSKNGWVATFTHQEPAGDRGNEILWYRIFWETRGDELVVTRVDELSAVGDMDAMPSTVALLEDYRDVDRVQVPYRVRMFRFGNTFLLGSVLNITEVKLNAEVTTPKSLKIPAGTSVHDEILGTRYRTFNWFPAKPPAVAKDKTTPAKPSTGARQ